MLWELGWFGWSWSQAAWETDRLSALLPWLLVLLKLLTFSLVEPYGDKSFTLCRHHRAWGRFNFMVARSPHSGSVAPILSSLEFMLSCLLHVPESWIWSHPMSQSPCYRTAHCTAWVELPGLCSPVVASLGHLNCLCLWGQGSSLFSRDFFLKGEIKGDIIFPFQDLLLQLPEVLFLKEQGHSHH